MTAFPNLFRPLDIRGCRLKNRIVFAPHGIGQTPEHMVAYHRARAEGGVGLIVLQGMTIHRSYQVGRTPSVVDDSCIPWLTEIAKVVHSLDTRVFGQLFHPGRSYQGFVEGARIPAWAPSEVPSERYHVMPAPMPRDMIREIVSAYGDAARRMIAAGLDGVEILVSHGYLPAQFLSEKTNRRTDEYGGSFDNRLRFVHEILSDVRSKISDHTILGIRMSIDEIEYDEWSPDQTISIVNALTDEGLIDYVSLVRGSSSSVGGAMHIAPPMAMPAGYLGDDAGTVKKQVKIPVLLTGRINDPHIAEGIVANGKADFIGMARALICDPYFAAKATAGKLDDIRACIGCNQACIGHRYAGHIVSCIQHPESGRELTYPHTKTRAQRRRKVLVVGGGPGGMKAAAIAAERGHDVTLYERTSRLGGQALLAQMLPGRSEFGGIVTNLTREMELSGVNVRRNVAVDAALVSKANPDVLIVATGATPYWPELDGVDPATAVDAWKVIRGEANVGSNVVVADWRCDWVGLGVAEMLVRQGSVVRLYCQGLMPGHSLPDEVRDHWIGVLDHLGVEMKPYVRLFGRDGNDVYFQHMTNGHPVVCENVDTLVLAQGHRRDAALLETLGDWKDRTHVIGDAVNPRTAEEAVLEGLKAAMAI